MRIYSSDIQSLTIDQIGGKGLNLYRLKKIGLNVPDWVVIDQNALETLLNGDAKARFDQKEICNVIDDYEFDDDFLDTLRESFTESKSQLFAVRSSAVQEDGQSFSFAGQFETYLYVNFLDIPKFVKEIWKSNFSDRVANYQKANNLKPTFGIGVIIQKMIDPDVSGVGFGINPNTGERGSKVICSVYGVGEGLVSGELNADTFTLNEEKIEELLVDKVSKANRGRSGEITFVDVAENRRKIASLTKEEITKLSSILDALEKQLGEPQDIEFAVKNGIIYLLQTRPITAVIHKKIAHSTENRIIWDNSNIIESYPGVTTPLTFSYILEAYKSVYLQIASIMGVSAASLKENEDTFGNMLGLINGRVYYNLLSWYKVLALFPGYKLNARFMENMMGVKERFDLPKQGRFTKFSAFMRTSWMIIKIIGKLSSIKRETREFQVDVERSVKRIKSMNLSDLSAFELMQTWIDLDAELTPKWEAPLVNDSFAMYYFGKLQKTIDKYDIGENKNIQNDLLCGSKDIISVEPIHRTIELATIIKKDSVLEQLFTNNDASPIWVKLQASEHVKIKAEIDRYIDDFGDRCVGELKLETISYTQDPSLFIAIIKSFVVQNITKSSTSSTVDVDLRNAAEAEISKALKGKFWRRRKLNKVLKKTRYFVSNRENLRYERTRVFGLSREIFTQIGKQFEKNGALTSHRDIFFLTKVEIFAFIQGTSVDKDLIALTYTRKIEYKNFEKMELPAERFETFDAVNYGNDFFDSSKENLVDGNLSGLGCCPGLVKAKVRIVGHPSEIDSLNGDILVTSSTDPGWVTLFPSASAIIVERGSLLSHSAIVSREMGIPCIVGVTGLLKRLRTGDLIEMDGSTGEIKIINDE